MNHQIRKSDFRKEVEILVARIPKGRVMTYGQLAALCGRPRAARIVGGIAHFGDPELPWHRVVNKQGGLASGYPGGKFAHQQHLESEGVEVSDDYCVDVKKLLWRPGDVEASAMVLNSNFQRPTPKPPLVVIVGPTASGKSALGMQLAKKFGGEIICADSRTVYKGLDIGTAKPSQEDQETIPHHLLDVVDPGESFNVVDFKRLANQAINEISARGKLPIMVGGSGLYTDAVLFDYEFSAPSAPRDPQNPRHLHKEAPRSRKPLRPDTLIIGTSMERHELKKRISKRVEGMIEAGLAEEVRWLAQKFPESKALQAPGYRAVLRYFENDISLQEAKNLFIQNDYRLAKRQMTWFGRNEYIQWAKDQRQAVEFATTFLYKYR
ncbi:MAG: MGMT family protein [Candidatus Saccharibacteria bacterium]|nr:MGMT family protein [Candidatus Saccharibacteria bacterium]